MCFTVNGQSILDSCFQSASPGTSFSSSAFLADATDADLLQWNGSSWIGAWSTAQVNLVPPCDLPGSRAIWMGDQTSWTTGGEGFALKLNQSLVAGTTYSFTFTYASNGIYNFGNFSPNFSTSSGTNYATSYQVAQLPPVGTSWETHAISFTATAAQSGHTWIFIHSNDGSGIVLNLCQATFSGGVDIGADTTLCIGDTLVLSANAGYDSYTWNTGDTTSSITIDTAGTYFVTASLQTCIATDSITIAYIPCNFPQSSFMSSDTAVCEKFCVDFTDQSTNSPTSWIWSFPGGNPSSSTDQNPTSICYNNPGTYDVTLITFNANGSDTLISTGFIVVNPTPAIPVITQNGYTLTSSTAISYQWQLNSVDIPGATNQSYTVTQSGFYTVLITDQNGCNAASTTIYVLITGIENVSDALQVLIYPNPSKGNFIIEFLSASVTDRISFEVVNMLGQTVYAEEASGPTLAGPDFKKEIMLDNNAAGIYFLRIKSGDEMITEKVMISR